MKAGDTAYLVESNRFVREVEILRYLINDIGE